VLRRNSVEMVGRCKATGARHVLRHDRGIARDMASEVATHGTRIGVIAGADRGADDKPQLLALVEVADRVGAGRWTEGSSCGGPCHGQGCGHTEQVSAQHGNLLGRWHSLSQVAAIYGPQMNNWA